MNVVVLINGREAIPVRAIPFVTGRWMSPDVVAKSFARTDHWRDMKDVPAYQLLGGAIHGPVLPKEWDVVEDLLQALESRLNSLSDDRTVTRPTWIIESTALLPPAVFVWKDQFEQYFRREYSPQKLHWIDERPGDRELNFSPMITPPELRDVVMAGFELLAESAPAPDTPQQVPAVAPEQPRASGTSEKSAPEVTLDDWKAEARAIADECFDSDTRNNCRDSLAGYSRRVMEEMQQRKIHGPRGRIDNHGTIQREALQADLWWARKKNK